MSTAIIHEPFVILERDQPFRAAPARTIPEGRRPELLIVDADADSRRSLGRLLDESGFEVFHSDGFAAARALVESRHSILMVLLRLDQPQLESLRLIRALARLRPGIWIGMRVPVEDRRLAEQGYHAGADDLLPLAVPLPDLAARLAHTLTGALRKRERIARERRSGARRVARAGLVVTTVAALAMGMLMGLLMKVGLDVLDAGEARLDRLEKATEAVGERRDLRALRADLGARSEMLDFQRGMHFDDMRFRRERLEEERFGHLFKNLAPSYSDRGK